RREGRRDNRAETGRLRLIAGRGIPPKVDLSVSDVSGIVVQQANGIEDGPTGVDRAVRRPIVIGIDIVADRRCGGFLDEKKGGRGVLEFALAVLSAMAQGTGGTASPTAAAVRVGENRGERVRLVTMKLLQQQQKTVLTYPSAGQVEQILDSAWVGLRVALHRDQISAIGDQRVGLAPQFDIFVGGIRTGRVQKDLADVQLG